MKKKAGRGRPKVKRLMTRRELKRMMKLMDVRGSLIADKLGVTRQSVSNWITGVSGIPNAHVPNIRKILKEG